MLFDKTIYKKALSLKIAKKEIKACNSDEELLALISSKETKHTTIAKEDNKSSKIKFTNLNTGKLEYTTNRKWFNENQFDASGKVQFILKGKETEHSTLKTLEVKAEEFTSLMHKASELGLDIVPMLESVINDLSGLTK